MQILCGLQLILQYCTYTFFCLASVPVMVNFMSTKDTQPAGKILFLGVSMRAFPGEISICISTLSKGEPPSPMWVALLLWGYNTTKRQRKHESTLSTWAGFFSFCLRTFEVLVLGSSDSDWILLAPFQVFNLHIADTGIS